MDCAMRIVGAWWEGGTFANARQAQWEAGVE